MLRPTLRAGCLAASLAACGARSALLDPAPAGLDASTRPDAPARPDTPARPDAPPPLDAPPVGTCSRLEFPTPPAVVLSASAGASYATPRVVARAGGFDVFAPLSSPGALAVRGRRLTLTGGGAIARGPEVVLGENAFTWAEGGSDGTRLALAYGAPAPTFRAWTGAYTSLATTSLAFVGAAGSSAGIAWRGDRWVLAWPGSDIGPTPSRVLELDPDGSVLTMARPAGVDLGAANPSIVAYANGVAWAGTGAAPDSLSVVFSRRGARFDDVRAVRVRGAHATFRVARFGDSAPAVALAWRDVDTNVHLAVVAESGPGLDDRAVPGLLDAGTPRALEIAPFRDGLVYLDARCDPASLRPGSFALHRVDAAAAWRGPSASLEFDCRGDRTIASVATDGDTGVLVWTTLRAGSASEFDIAAAAFRCVP